MTALPSMAAFALAASISPGPVNIVALTSGARYGLLPSLRHVTGATFGFTLLLLLTGLGLSRLLLTWPSLAYLIQWLGIGFLLFMAGKLAADQGDLEDADAARGPSMTRGAVMQWLNPKAWLAALAGMGAYVTPGDGTLIWQFSALYFGICYLSIACWACAGAYLKQYLLVPGRMRWFNRAMGLLLAVSAAGLLLSAPV